MKYFFIFFITLLVTPPRSTAQIFCISDKQFVCPELARRAGLSASFLVRFDIVGFVPGNFQFYGADGNSTGLIEMFKGSIIDNLSNLIYLKDSIGFQLKAQYRIRGSGLLTANFAEVVSSNEIDFVFRKPLLDMIGDPAIQLADPNIDSVFLDATVPYKSGKAHPSNILVERRFNTRDSIIILRNNYPDLEEELHLVAGHYLKGRFLTVGSKAKHYFIRFRVERNLPECGVKQYF